MSLLANRKKDPRRQSRSSANGTFRRKLRRRLSVELLEARCVPATIVVNSLADGTTPLGQVTLRDAIQAANTNQSVNGSVAGSPGADTIAFAPALTATCSQATPCTIRLDTSLGQLSISEPLTVQAPGSAKITLDARGNSRLFDIAASAGDVTLDGLILTGGRTTGTAPSNDFTFFGGAIRFLSGGTLTLRNCTLTGNATQGVNSGGGAVFTGAGAVTLDHSVLQDNSAAFRGGAVYAGTGAVTLTDSTLSDNSTPAGGSNGGGLFVDAGPLTVQNSTVSGNHTAQNGARGGGIFVRGPASGAPLAVTVTGSTISGNYTQGDNASGGGIYVLRNTALTVTGSTVSGNHTQGAFATGGGINLDGGTLTVRDSTISDNHTTGRDFPGGGIFGNSNATTAVIDSTVAYNGTTGSASQGGGIGAFGDVTLTNSTVAGNTVTMAPGGGVASDRTLTLTSSIVADNTAAGGNVDVLDDLGHLGASSSLVGNGDGTSLTPGANGNLIGTAASPVNPMLGPLQDNGGPTKTMALMPGSPAIRAGVNPLGLITDQRGFPFLRVTQGNGIPDMGAFELQTALNLVVTSAEDRRDATPDPSNLTLRDAVDEADVNPFGPTTITFAPSLSGVPIRLTLGQLPMNQAVTIRGLGAANTVIDAQHNSRIFFFDSAAYDILEGMTLTGGVSALPGYGGGAVLFNSTGTLYIRDSILTGNSSLTFGGAIATAPHHGYGSLDVVNSTISGNSTTGTGYGGGGIDATRLLVSHSTISGNFTQGANADGGGILAGSRVELIDSTVSGNHTQGANATGGGIACDGVDFYGPSLGVIAENSTIANNYTRDPSAAAGGVASKSSVTLTSSIVAGNHDNGSNPDLKPGSGSLTVTNSLVGDNTGTGLTATGPTTPDSNGNLIGSAGGRVNPQLGQLADNGGPTQTMALSPSSPAVHRGANPLGLTTDQRGTGFARVVAGQTDMGAFELQPPHLQLLVVNANDVLHDGTDPSDMSLRDAVALANKDVGQEDTITFDPSLRGVPIKLTLGELVITNDVVIRGLGAADTVIDAQQQSRLFDVPTDNFLTLTLEGMTLTGGRTTPAGNEGSGGAIRFLSPGGVSVLDCVVSGNSTQGDKAEGGAIVTDRTSSAVLLDGSTLSGNATQGNGADGGGVSAGGSVLAVGSTVAGNMAHGSGAEGGGILADGALTLTESTVAGNATNDSGGGIVARGTLTLNNSTVAGNSAQKDGGGIVAGEEAEKITSSIVAGNTAGGKWPDLKVLSLSSLSLSHSLIGDNRDTPLTPTGLSPDANGNLIGSDASPIDPLLGPLQDNGGSTPTLALLPGSPAIGLGSNPLGLRQDQRGFGFARSVGGAVDMGAFQVQAPPSPPPTQPAPLPLPPPVTLPDPVGVVLVSRGRGPVSKLFVEVRYADGRPPRLLRSPFRKGRYRAITASLADLDRDGVPDAVLFSARLGKRRVTRTVRL
jgi:CSLREA domain-containing protein